MLQTKTYRLRGVVELRQSSLRAANPMDPLVMRRKELLSIQGKDRTDSTLQEISDIEWSLSMYVNTNGEPSIPAENFERMLSDAAGSKQRGLKSKIIAGVVVLDDAKIDHGGGSLAKIKKDPAYRLVKMMSVSKTNKAKILKTRPVFPQWEVDLKLNFDDAIIDERTIDELLDYAGQRVGLCDSRPKKGRFEVIA